MTTIDIITAVGRPDPYLSQAGESLAKFAELTDAELTWWLASDGPTLTWIESATQNVRGIQRHILPPIGEGLTGPARTRNRALAASRGDAIMVLDSDDLYLPDETASLFRRFQTESAPWAAGRVVDIDEHGSHLWSGPFIDLDDGWTDLDCVRTHAATFGYAPFHCSATIARREVLEAVGGWDESATFVRSEDVAMWARVARDHRGWFSHRPVLNYRRHDGSITKASLWREGHPGMTVLDLIDTPAESRGFTADLKAHR